MGKLRKAVRAALEHYGVWETLEDLAEDRDYLMDQVNDIEDDISNAVDGMIDVNIRLDEMEKRIRKIETGNGKKLTGIAIDEADDDPPPAVKKTRPDGMVQEYPPIGSEWHSDWDAPMNVTREQIGLALDDILNSTVTPKLADMLYDQIMHRLACIEEGNNQANG